MRAQRERLIGLSTHDLERSKVARPASRYRDEPRGSRERSGEDQSRRGAVSTGPLCAPHDGAHGDHGLSLPSRSPSSGGPSESPSRGVSVGPWCPECRSVFGLALARRCPEAPRTSVEVQSSRQQLRTRPPMRRAPHEETTRGHRMGSQRLRVPALPSVSRAGAPRLQRGAKPASNRALAVPDGALIQREDRHRSARDSGSLALCPPRCSSAVGLTGRRG